MDGRSVSRRRRFRWFAARQRPEHAAANVPHLVNEGQGHKRPAKGHDGETRQEATQPRAEPQRTGPLHPAHVELAAAIDAVQGRGQPPIGAEQLVAAENAEGPRQVGQLEIVARYPVAQVAHRQEPAVADLIEQFLDQFFSRHSLGQVLRSQLYLVQRGGNDRAEPPAEPGLDAADRLAHELGELPPPCVGDPRRGQPPLALRKCFNINTSRWFGNCRLIGRRPHDSAHSTRSTV